MRVCGRATVNLTNRQNPRQHWIFQKSANDFRRVHRTLKCVKATQNLVKSPTRRPPHLREIRPMAKDLGARALIFEGKRRFDLSECSSPIAAISALRKDARPIVKARK